MILLRGVCSIAGHVIEQEYSVMTVRSLANVDESLLNYELLERLMCHIIGNQQDRSSEANAILIFLPGAPEISRLTRALQVLHSATMSCEVCNNGIM